MIHKTRLSRAPVQGEKRGFVSFQTPGDKDQVRLEMSQFVVSKINDIEELESPRSQEIGTLEEGIAEGAFDDHDRGALQNSLRPRQDLQFDSVHIDLEQHLSLQIQFEIVEPGFPTDLQATNAFASVGS